MKFKCVHTKCIILLMGFVLLRNTIAGAQTGDSTNNEKRLAVTVYFTPEYVYRTLKGNDMITTMRDTLEIAKPAFSAGAGISYKLHKKIILQTGISISNKGEQSKKINLGNSFSQLDLPVYSSYINSFYFVGIPVKANYILLDKKIKLFVTGGLNADLLVKAVRNTQLEYTSKQTENTISGIDFSTFNKLQLSAVAGFGIQTMLDNKTSISITPLYTYAITSFTPSPLKTHYYSLGINIGLHFYIL